MERESWYLTPWQNIFYFPLKIVSLLMTKWWPPIQWKCMGSNVPGKDTSTGVRETEWKREDTEMSHLQSHLPMKLCGSLAGGMHTVTTQTREVHKYRTASMPWAKEFLTRWLLRSCHHKQKRKTHRQSPWFFFVRYQKSLWGKQKYNPITHLQRTTGLSRGGWALETNVLLLAKSNTSEAMC